MSALEIASNASNERLQGARRHTSISAEAGSGDGPPQDLRTSSPISSGASCVPGASTRAAFLERCAASLHKRMTISQPGNEDITMTLSHWRYRPQLHCRHHQRTRSNSMTGSAPPGPSSQPSGGFHAGRHHRDGRTAQLSGQVREPQRQGRSGCRRTASRNTWPGSGMSPTRRTPADLPDRAEGTARWPSPYDMIIPISAPPRRALGVHHSIRRRRSG